MANVMVEGTTAPDPMIKNSSQIGSVLCALGKRNASEAIDCDASKRRNVENDSNEPLNTRNPEPIEETSQEVANLQQKVSKLEKMFQRACRAAREAELRAEFAENIIDTKAGVKDDAGVEKERAEKLQQRLAEVSSELEQQKIKEESRLAFEKSKLDKLSQKLIEMEYRCSLSAGNSVLDREVELYRENEGLKREMEHMRRIMESMDCHHAENGNLQSRFNWAMNELENERTRSKNALYVASGDSVRDKGRISELNRKLCDFERRERVWKEEKEKLTMKITIAQGMTTNTTNCHSNSIEPEVTVIDGPEEARVLHPLDIFQPCKNSKDSMPADVAFSRLRTKHELECNRVKFHRMMLPFINKKLCPVCGISLGDVGHLLGKKHLNKIKAYGGRVSKSAFEYWMKKMDESLMKKKIGATASVQAVVSAAKEVSTTNDKREKTLTTVVKKASTPSAAAVANKAIVQQVITPSVTQLKQKTLSKSLSHILNCGSENHVNEVNIRVALSSLCDKWDSSVRKSEIRRETKGLMMLCDSCDTNALNVDALMEHLKEENHINKMIQTKTKVCTEAVSEWMEMMKE